LRFLDFVKPKNLGFKTHFDSTYTNWMGMFCVGGVCSSWLCCYWRLLPVAVEQLH